MTLMFNQGHSVVKLHEAAQIIMMVDYVMEMVAKKSCKYGEYGLCEHLLFLSSRKKEGIF